MFFVGILHTRDPDRVPKHSNFDVIKDMVGFLEIQDKNKYCIINIKTFGPCVFTNFFRCQLKYKRLVNKTGLLSHTSRNAIEL